MAGVCRGVSVGTWDEEASPGPPGLARPGWRVCSATCLCRGHQPCLVSGVHILIPPLTRTPGAFRGWWTIRVQRGGPRPEKATDMSRAPQDPS